MKPEGRVRKFIAGKSTGDQLKVLRAHPYEPGSNMRSVPEEPIEAKGSLKLEFLQEEAQ